jgi:hypothetical protein
MLSTEKTPGLTVTVMNLKTYITVLIWKVNAVWYSCMESLVLAWDREFRKTITNHFVNEYESSSL